MQEQRPFHIPHSACRNVPASAVSSDAVGGILADYVALDQVRLVRRLLLKRCGRIAALVLLVALLLPGSLAFRTIGPALLLVPPAWAWVIERRLVRRLAKPSRSSA